MVPRRRRRAVVVCWIGLILAIDMVIMFSLNLNQNVNDEPHLASGLSKGMPLCINISGAPLEPVVNNVSGAPLESVVNDASHSLVKPTINEIKLDSTLTSIKPAIVRAMKKLYKAKQHVRGSKTSDNLGEAIVEMEKILNLIGVDNTDLKYRQTVKPKNICPETFNGTTFGYPFFYKGFITVNCTYGKPITELVTVLYVNGADTNRSQIETFINSVYAENEQYKVMIALNAKTQEVTNFQKLFPNVTFANTGTSLASSLNTLIAGVTTPYVLVSRHVERFTNDSRIERLVREIESLQVSVAAASYRTPDGHWKNGCWQSVYRNYSLQYVEGYDESKHECMFCDYAAGSFVASKDVLKKYPFSNIADDRGLFEDWFLQLSQRREEAVVCPDSMFHVEHKEEHNHHWVEFMRKWDLYKLVTPLDQTFILDCSKGYPGGMPSSMGSHPCRLQGNVDAVKMIMRKCKEGNMICELQEGTSLGAVKFGKVLPWERDGDLAFLTANFTGFKALSSAFNKEGGNLHVNKDPWCCVDNRNAGGIMKVSKAGWMIEMWGQHIMDSELLIAEGIAPTQLLWDGEWVNVPRNPGLFSRNRYGREIYQHALHWMTTGDNTGWINYKTNTFMRCSTPGHHACYDRYNADGNLQFKGMMP